MATPEPKKEGTIKKRLDMITRFNELTRIKKMEQGRAIDQLISEVDYSFSTIVKYLQEEGLL